MASNFEKIKERIRGSDLPSDEKEELLVSFASAGDADLEPVVKLFEMDPSWVKKASQNFKAKTAAIVTGNSALWRKIINAEEAELKRLERQ